MCQRHQDQPQPYGDGLLSLYASKSKMSTQCWCEHNKHQTNFLHILNTLHLAVQSFYFCMGILTLKMEGDNFPREARKLIFLFLSFGLACLKALFLWDSRKFSNSFFRLGQLNQVMLNRLWNIYTKLLSWKSNEVNQQKKKWNILKSSDEHVAKKDHSHPTFLIP